MASIKLNTAYTSEIISGKRNQVIIRGHEIKINDPLYIYVPGNGRPVRLTRCDDAYDDDISNAVIILDNKLLDDDEKLLFVQKDGFNNFDEFKAWHKNIDGLPIHGQVVRWL